MKNVNIKKEFTGKIVSLKNTEGKDHAAMIRRINVNVTKAYFGFLFQTFLKRPFGYIISLLYILYLCVILMIVPAATHRNPLFIWNLGGFNMAMFNLFFIAAIAASIAVVIFRIGIEDGTELSLSAKPITKGRRVGVKTAVYLIIMLIICAITLALLALIKPIFGEYDLFTNITGITNKEYTGLLLSVFVGNVVNMLLFGGISVFITLVGGQVITIIASIGIAFIMCLLNFIYPLAVGTPKSVIRNTYNTEINSFSALTRSQIEGTDQSYEYKPWAAIQCATDVAGEELAHYDTYTYWTRANKESGTFVTNYLDFGKQLSSLFSGFGLDDNRLKEASKVSIGTNLSYKYTIDKNTHVTDDYVKYAKEYPVAIYSMLSKQGVAYPIVNIMGGNTGIDIDNWYAASKLSGADYNSVTLVSLSEKAILSSTLLAEKVGKTSHTWLDLNIAGSMAQRKQAAENLLNSYIEKINATYVAEPWATYKKDYSADDTNAFSAINIIKNDESGVFFEKGKWDDMGGTPEGKTLQTAIISQIVIFWMAKCQEMQNEAIANYLKSTKAPEEIKNDTFPYSSKTVLSWYGSEIEDQSGNKNIPNYNKQKLMEQIFQYGVQAGTFELKTGGIQTYYVYPLNASMEFCETYKNLYKYNVRSYFNVTALTVIWTSIAASLFAVAIVIYKKTDFK